MASDEVRMSVLEDRVMQLGDEVKRLEAQLGVTESTDSQKDHLRAGIRAWLAGDRVTNDWQSVGYFENLLNTEPKGTP